jgi:transposase
MEVVHERCAGLDVHKKTVVACVVWGAGKGGRETRTFGTMTAELRSLRDWLVGQGCSAVAMESTGSYWKPIFNLLEETGMQVMVVNAAHIKAVPGRKTDVCDAQWIADLLRHGLLRASFIPGREQRELRELVRYRRSVIQERSREVARLHKVLEGANIKVQAVASSVMGASCQAMLKALVDGCEDPEKLAELALGRLRKKRDELVRALEGIMGAHQRFLLEEQLRHIEELNARVERLSSEIARRMLPFEHVLVAIDEIPGIARTGAEEIIAETGVDMSRFPSEEHFASWAKVCPGNNETGGKRRSGRTGKGNPWLGSTLVEAANAAARCKSSYLSVQYHRMAARRGGKRAAVAVAHSILVIIYHMLKNGTAYKDLGADYFDRRNKDAIARRATRRLEALGFTVVLTKTAPPPPDADRPDATSEDEAA